MTALRQRMLVHVRRHPHLADDGHSLVGSQRHKPSSLNQSATIARDWRLGKALACLVWAWLFDVINHYDVHWFTCRLQPQPKLRRHCSE